MPKKAYLDNHTTTRPFPEVIEKMLPFYKEYWGSLSSPHQMGQELYPFVNESLEILYQGIGARREDSFQIAASGRDAISQVLLSTYLYDVKETGRNHFLTTNIEEAGTLYAIKQLEPLGCSGKMIPVNSQGQLTKEALQEAIKPRTSLLSISWANGLTGVINPISDLAEVCKEKKIKLHVDATYVMGKLFWLFEDIGADFLTFDAERMHGPKGTAVIFQKGKANFPALTNTAGLIGLCTAVDGALFHFDHLCTETARLRDKLEKGIQEGFSDACIFFQDVERLPNCTAIGFPGVASDALLYLLDRQGVFASMGGGNSQRINHVLTASGIDKELANSALSFSLSYETTEEEIDYAIDVIISSAKKLQKLSCNL